MATIFAGTRRTMQAAIELHPDEVVVGNAVEHCRLVALAGKADWGASLTSLRETAAFEMRRATTGVALTVNTDLRHESPR